MMKKSYLVRLTINFTVVEGHFILEPEDAENMSETLKILYMFMIDVLTFQFDITLIEDLLG
jgi:flagellin-specific chaperone FliS